MWCARRMTARAASVAALAVALAGAAPAAADVLEDDRPIERRGLVVGVHGGWGLLLDEPCDGCGVDVGGFAGLRLGGMIGRRFALLGGVAWGGQGGHVVVSFDVVGRYVATPRWWFDGGVGLGRVDVDEGNERDARFTGGAWQLAAGYDLFQGDAFAFDVSLRSMFVRSEVVGGDRRRNDLVTSFQLGATWY